MRHVLEQSRQDREDEPDPDGVEQHSSKNDDERAVHGAASDEGMRC
jgi:hypothetical protein